MNVSSSNAFSFRGSIPVEIVSEGGYAELSLVDAAYNVVGQGIGRLDLTLPPGQYQLRQCIGDAQTLEAIDIERTNVEANQAAQRFTFPAPKFTSAALVRDETAVLGMAPASETSLRASHRHSLRLIISASMDEALEIEDRELAISHLRNESARLRLESLKGELLLGVGKVSFFDKSSSATIHELQVEVDPGEYVLVQSGAGSQGHQASRQRCLPLIVTTGFSPRVYLRTLLTEKPLEPTAVPVPVDLDTASVIYWPKDTQDSPGTFELGLIESARKALIRGHAIGGYWNAASRPEGSPTKSPLLALMDGYLLLSELSAHGAGLSQVGTAIKDAEALLGSSFTDVVALRLAATKVSPEDAEVLPGFQSDAPDLSLSGPPLLARSWHELLVNERANQELSRVMPFEYVPEATGTWFTWTEAVGTRTQEKYPDKTIAPEVKEAPSTGLSGLFKRYYSRPNAEVLVTAAAYSGDRDR
jgi:hypothetical protein